MEETGGRVCERCGAKFVCDMAAGKSSCWCFELPRVMPVIPSTSCLCPKCLETAVKQQIAVPPARTIRE